MSQGIRQEYLVSVITPVFNCEDVIERSLLSVLEQTHTNWELILVDDNSPDGSVDVINKFLKKDSRIKLIRLEENKGAGHARNVGLENAVGKYVAFLDADDYWHEHKLAKQVEFMQSNNAVFSFTSYQRLDEKGLSKGYRSAPKKVSYKELIRFNSIGCLTVMLDKDFFGQIRFPLIRKRQDYALWLQLLKKTKYAYGLDEVLAFYSVGGNSLSANKFSAARYNWHLYRNIEGHGIFSSAYFFLNYAVKNVLLRIFKS